MAVNERGVQDWQQTTVHAASVQPNGPISRDGGMSRFGMLPFWRLDFDFWSKPALVRLDSDCPMCQIIPDDREVGAR
jgi:hypothetical protein